MSGELGRASLDLEANVASFERNIASAERTGAGMQDRLDAIASVAEVAQRALNEIKLSASHAAESRASAEGILSGVRGISDDARTAARELDRVRLSESQAAETEASATLMSRALDKVSRNADEAKRKLAEVRLSGGRNGVGLGPIGSGYGRVGVLGTAIGVGVLTAPAAVPAAAGLLAAIPTFAAGGIGALGTLALALDGVSKAIGGDKKAFDGLTPSAKQFVQTVRSLDGTLDRLREVAGKGLFPGLTQGLRAALSPGTLGAISTAVSELARALGQAGAAWGRYFGSREFQSIFGPLMQSAARNIGVLSNAALRLFDALGVVARAAIPLTNWISDSIGKGAKLADAWLHAKDASGALAHGLGEAKTSLQLVAGLAKSLLGAVGALGQALYPVSKIAVKDLTDGLNALAGIIDRNRQTIRDLVGGALSAFVSTIKLATDAAKLLWPILNNVKNALGGWAHFFEVLIGLKVASVVTGWAGAFKKLASAEALGAASSEAKSLETSMTRLRALGPIALAVTIDAQFIGPLKSFMERHFGADFSPLTPDVATSPSIVSKLQLVAPKGTSLAGDLAAISAGRKLSPGQIADVLNAFKRGDLTGGNVPTAAQIKTLTDDLHHPGRGLPKRKPTTHTPPTTRTSPFGASPPFTTNTGAVSAIPALASHAEQLASANASRSSALGNVGAMAKKYLDAELADLTTADKLIRDKYETATGKARTQLFAALTSVENKMRSVRAQIAKAVKDGRADQLRLAVDQAKEAVAAAAVGSAAYDKARAAEETAIKAEIAYWQKVADNVKLGSAARDKAVRIVAADQKALKQLLAPVANQAAENEQLFLQSVADIESQFAPNAFPGEVDVKHMGQVATHLYDVKHELRGQSATLKKIAAADDFPSSSYALATVGALAG